MDKYVLVLWPELQSFMDEDWFRSECYLCVTLNEEQEHHDSAYFIPEEKYNKFMEKKVDSAPKIYI